MARVVVLMTIGCAPALASNPAAQKYQGLVEVLASPDMEGRGPGTAGLDRARDFLARQFFAIGLKPAFGAKTLGHGRAYTQPFTMTLRVRAKRQSLEFRVGDEESFVKAGAAKEHFSTLGFSANGSFEGQVAFVGYGIVEADFKYDSYAGIGEEELEGKVFVAFRYEPRGKDGRSRWSGKKGRPGPWSQAAHLTSKARLAQERGARALLVVNPPSLDRGSLKSTARSVFSPAAAIPVLHISTDTLKRMLRPLDSRPDKSLKRWQQLADQGKDRVEVFADLVVRGDVALGFPKIKVSNVAAVLPGTGRLADELIVLGAHYDHLGYGGPGAFVKGHHLYPGADDNASGTAGLLMLAERLAQLAEIGPANRRTILFAAFTAEERGLLGSNHMVNQLNDLGISSDQIVAMLNMDMIGRMRNEKLIALGSSSSKQWKSMLKEASTQVGLKLKTRNPGAGASDHINFYRLKVPVLHLFTGVHKDYHRPSDTPDKINAEGAVKVLDVITLLTRRLWSQSPRLVFAPSQMDPNPHATVGAGSFLGRTYLGVIPDYASGDGNVGCALSDISPDGPAE